MLKKLLKSTKNKTYVLKSPKVLQFVLIFLACGLLGLHFLDPSFAATFAVSQEAENGTLSGNASTIADGNASNSGAVTFGTSADALMQRQDLIYGTEIGAWRPDGKPTIDTTTNIPSLTQAAGITSVRFAESDCFQGMTCGTDNHAGTATKANFDSAINGIINNLGAVPIIKLEPIAGSDTINGINQSVFCPPTNNLAMNLPMDEAIVAYAGNRVHLYESTNEGEYDCASTWGYPSAGSAGVSTILGEHFAQNMPALKKYARGLGINIKTIGYIGVAGGVGWGQTCTTPRLRSIDEFNNAAYQAYVNAGNDPDYIPDAESIHSYPFPSDFPETSSVECVYQYYKLFIQDWRQELVNIWGPTIGNQIKLADTEWEAGQLSWSQWSNPSAVESFDDGWIKYVLQGQALPDASVGTTERLWAANLFDDATDNDNYDFIKPDGTTQPWYDTFKTDSLNDPNR